MRSAYFRRGDLLGSAGYHESIESFVLDVVDHLPVHVQTCLGTIAYLSNGRTVLANQIAAGVFGYEHVHLLVLRQIGNETVHFHFCFVDMLPLASNDKQAIVFLDELCVILGERTSHGELSLKLIGRTEDDKSSMLAGLRRTRLIASPPLPMKLPTQ